jgi:hypothetical protein
MPRPTRKPTRPLRTKPRGPLGQLIFDAVVRRNLGYAEAVELVNRAAHTDGEKNTRYNRTALTRWLTGTIPHPKTQRWIGRGLDIPDDRIGAAVEALRDLRLGHAVGAMDAIAPPPPLREDRPTRLADGELISVPVRTSDGVIAYVVTRRTFLTSLAAAEPALVSPGARMRLLGDGPADLAADLADGRARVTIDSAAQWLAWEMWKRRSTRMHESQVPSPIAQHLATVPPTAGTMTLRSADGFYSFAHDALIDLFVAQRIFRGIGGGQSALLAIAQTAHEADQVLCEFVLRHQSSVSALLEWMKTSTDPGLRVNSAGILAKLESVSLAGTVVGTLDMDAETRQLYLTAVASRVLDLEWSEASTLVADHQQVLGSVALNRASAFALRLASETRNPRDGAARWCSVVLLRQLQRSAPDAVSAALYEALQHEPSTENLRAIGSVLAGQGPVIS